MSAGKTVGVRRLLIVPLFAAGLSLGGCLGGGDRDTVTVTNTVVDRTYSHTNEDGSVETLHVTGTTVTATLEVPDTDGR